MKYINIDSVATPSINLDNLSLINHHEDVFKLKLVNGPGVTLSAALGIDGAFTRLMSIPMESLELRKDDLGYWWIY